MFVQDAQAQTQNGGYSSGGSYNVGSYLKNVGPVVKQLPLCKGKISGAVKSLFGGANIGKAGQILAKTGVKASLGDTADQKLSENTSIPITLPEYNNKQLQTIQDKTTATDKSVSALESNDTCLKSIGRMVIKLMLQKITLSTVEWINNGFEGKPLFLQNPGKFFEDIGKTQIRAFALEIDDFKHYPFAKNWLKSQVAAYNRKFADNARYSLDELIAQTTPQYTGLDFQADFSKGGWNAWTSLTSVPANNPLGFQLMAANELKFRLQGTTTPAAEKITKALDQANGYLGDERCADPEGITKEQDKAALIAGEKEISGASFIDMDGDGISNGVDINDHDHDNDGIEDDVDTDSNNNGIPDTIDGFVVIPVNDVKYTGYVLGTCKKWEYVTPGQMVAQAATKAINYPDNNLLNADDLNDAIGAVLDALLNKWTSDISAKGFAQFSNEGASGDLVLDYDAASSSGYTDVQTEKDFPSWQLGNDWLDAHPDFNIRTDLTQAVIDEQRIYIEKLEGQNEVIPKLIMRIRDLDYCIPGPNPNWETESSVDNFYDAVKFSPNLKGFGIAETALPIWGGLFDPTGIFSGIATAILENSKERTVKKQIATYLSKLFDVHIYGAKDAGDDNEQDQVLDEGDIRNLTENTFETYRQNIYNTYFAGAKSLAPMPIVTYEARTEFNKIKGYEQIAEDNFEEISLKKSVVTRLVQIKAGIEALGSNPSDDELKPWILFFGRLTKEMVTGDDIAKADNLLKEMKTQSDYVWNSLLKGPGGCEKEMENLYATNPNAYSKFYRRQPYRYPIDYLYGDEAGKTSTTVANPTIHTPWNENLINTWNPNEGFMYGSVYYNNWSGPWNGPSYGCPNEFINETELSLPSGEPQNGNIPDLGGLEPEGKGPYGKNKCGVITRKFEKMFGIY